ncbi:MAG: NADH-quinone oxidoreductase subunit J [Deltaproteobacteria bacterium]|jgi:NADH-quinone oxidoreductase subunit J
MREILFIAFSLFTIGAASGVLLARNPVYSAFSLILSFFGLSGLYLLWGSTFMAMIQILIYTGAIVVLFVFVVMLLNLQVNRENPSNLLTLGISAGAVWFFSLILLRVLTRAIPNKIPEIPTDQLRTISKLLFTRYLWPFEVLSLFLLVMIIAIFAITRTQEIPHGGEQR